jgi:hypothetical protein
LLIGLGYLYDIWVPLVPSRPLQEEFLIAS